VLPGREQLGKEPPFPVVPIRDEGASYRNASLPSPSPHTWTFGFWCYQAACPLGGQELGEALRAGNVSPSVCLHIRTCSLTHNQHTHHLCAPGLAYGIGKRTQTPSSLHKLKTHVAHFYFVSKKQNKTKNIPFSGKAVRTSNWAVLSYPGSGPWPASPSLFPGIWGLSPCPGTVSITTPCPPAQFCCPKRWPWE
jgi:hypothetical protein